MEYEWDDVIDEMCFNNIDYYQPSSRFDVSCSNSIEPWRSYTNDVKYKLIKYFNLASVQKGTCTTINESELGPAFSIMTACANNGAKLQTWEGSTDCSGDVKEEFIPWNFCYNGLLKLKYGTVAPFYPPDPVPEPEFPTEFTQDELTPTSEEVNTLPEEETTTPTTETTTEPEEEIQAEVTTPTTPTSNNNNLQPIESNPTQTLTQVPEATPEPVVEEETSNVGAIVGGVVGGITALVILIAVGFCYRAKSVSTNAVAAGSA